MLAESFLKVVYTRTHMFPSPLQERKEVYEVFPSGTVIGYKYNEHSKKPSCKAQWDVTPETIAALFRSIVDCLHTVTEVCEIIDDSGAQLRIICFGGEIELPRGFGSGESYIGGIMDRFISSLEMK